MRYLFYTGWALLLIAFLVTATDPYLTLLGSGGMWTPAYEVWYAYSPGSLIMTQIRIEKLAPFLWNPVITSILQVPGWVLFGVPGTALAWFCRPNKTMSPEMQEEYERHKESLFIIDELSREARKDENYDHGEDDQAPSHLLFDLQESEDEEIRASVTRGDIPADYPTTEYLENWDADLTRDDADGMGGINYETISKELDVSTLPPPGSIIIEEEDATGEETLKIENDNAKKKES